MVVALAAFVWVLSGMIGDNMRVPQADAGFPMRITSVDGDTVSYQGVPDGWTDQGRYAIRTPDGGYTLTGPQPVVGAEGSGTREVVRVVSEPPLAVGDRAALDGWYFGNDPAQVLGLDFEVVSYPTPLGDAAAWVIPGRGRTWVVYAHGRGDHPAQGLRLAQTVTALGYPMMLIQYRNDPEAPDAGGIAQAGATEWADLDAAVRYALDRGAKRVVLAGTSMGGSMALAFLANSDLADRVPAVVLDAPLVDFGASVEQGAADLGVPGFVTALAQQVAAWRYGFDWAAVDYVSGAGRLTVPMLITQGAADTAALPDRTEAFAAAAPPGLVQVEVFPEAGHTLVWNVDAGRFDEVVTAFLEQHAP